MSRGGGCERTPRERDATAFSLPDALPPLFAAAALRAPAPTDGLISVGSPASTLAYSLRWTVAFGHSVDTTTCSGARSFLRSDAGEAERVNE